MAVQIVGAGLDASAKSTLGVFTAVIVGSTSACASAAREWGAGLSTTGKLRAVGSLGTLASRSRGPIWPLSRSFCRDAHYLRRTFLAGEVFIVVFAYKAVTAEAVITEYAVCICIALCSTVDWGEPLIRTAATGCSIANVDVGGV